jgi:hypothetical protein
MDLDIIKKIDSIRGDVPRSKWIQKALESLAETIEKKSAQPVQVDRHDQADGSAIIPTRGTIV